MEYQKIANLIDDTPNQPSKFRTRNWVEINDESRGAYNVNSQIKFKTTMLKSSLCDYSDAYILVKGTITVNNTAAQGAPANNTNKKVIFKNCAPFTNCISEINNTQIDNAKDIDIVMPMYNLIEYSDNYAKTTGRLWQYCKNIPARNNGAIVIFAENNLTDSFNFKVKFTGQTGDDGTKDVEIMLPLKYLSNFWRTLEIPLINCEVNLILTWSSTCVLVASNIEAHNATFTITGRKLYVPLVTLSTQENTKFFQQLKSGFKRVINWNKYLSKPETYDNIRKIATGQGDDYTTGCLLDYPYFTDTYKMIAVDLSKQQALDADPRAIQQINFTANLDRAGNTRVYFIFEEGKETILDFSQGKVKVL